MRQEKIFIEYGLIFLFQTGSKTVSQGLKVQQTPRKEKENHSLRTRHKAADSNEEALALSQRASTAQAAHRGVRTSQDDFSPDTAEGGALGAPRVERHPVQHAAGATSGQRTQGPPVDAYINGTTNRCPSLKSIKGKKRNGSEDNRMVTSQLKSNIALVPSQPPQELRSPAAHTTGAGWLHLGVRATGTPGGTAPAIRPSSPTSRTRGRGSGARTRCPRWRGPLGGRGGLWEGGSS